jgi:hypothetical protein
MHDYDAVIKLLVTPTDFRRIWSAIDLTSRSNELLSWTEPTQIRLPVKICSTHRLVN